MPSITQKPLLQALRKGLALAPVTAPAVALRDVRKVHGEGDGAVVALDGISVGFSRGSFTAIMGPSGSGKSTLLHVAAGLDRPTSGTVALGETELAGLSERRLTILRRERIGFVFQAFNLMPSLTVTQNIGLPLRLAVAARGARRCARSRRASGWTSACATVPPSSPAVSSSASRSPGRSSRGPRWCSPTSRPARSTPGPGAGVLALLREVVDGDGHTVVMVTHDPVAAAHADRVILLADGRIAGMLDAPDADQVAEQLAHLGS